MDSSVTDAELILIGEIVGLLDSGAAAQQRRPLEVHRIRVLETLKGHEPVRSDISVRPSGQAWFDRERYVLFLHNPSPEGTWAEALDGPAVEANSANVDRIRLAINRAGFSALPRRVLWLVHAPSNRPEPITQLLVSEDGSYLWNHRALGTPHGETLTGEFTITQREHLVSLFADQTSRQAHDDQGTVRFGWVDVDGTVRSRTLPAADDPHMARIMNQVTELARTNAR